MSGIGTIRLGTVRIVFAAAMIDANVTTLDNQ
jgi:hypothetical protein